MLFIVTLISIYNYSPNISYACSCAEPYPVKEELERSSAVFSGKVVEIVDENKNKLIQSSADPIAVRFEVNETWKGQSQTQLLVYTERSSASCGYEFDLNKEYLVYASEVNGELKVSFCSRTKLLSTAITDIQELGKGEKPIKQVPVDSTNDEKQITPDNAANKNTIYIISIILGLLLVVIFKARRTKK